MSGLIYQADPRPARGLHALLVGVSAYPALPAFDADPPPKGRPKFELRQLTGTARSAARLARWIVAHRNAFDPPLATCRLLACPSAAEQKHGGTLFDGAAPADDANFLAAFRAWRDDALHPDSVTLFYFAGHGLQRTLPEDHTDQVLLLRDFGDDQSHQENKVFKHGVSVLELQRAMTAVATPIDPDNDPGMDAPHYDETSAWRLARRQFYLFDACRNAPPELAALKKTACLDLGDEPVPASHDDRETALLHATMSDRRAYARPGGLTLFASALMACLRGGAGERDPVINPANQRWNLTLDALERGLECYLRRATRTPVSQKIQRGGTMRRETIFCGLDRPPRLPLTVHLQPAGLCASAHVQVPARRQRPGLAAADARQAPPAPRAPAGRILPVPGLDPAPGRPPGMEEPEPVRHRPARLHHRDQPALAGRLTAARAAHRDPRRVETASSGQSRPSSEP